MNSVPKPSTRHLARLIPIFTSSKREIWQLSHILLGFEVSSEQVEGQPGQACWFVHGLKGLGGVGDWFDEGVGI